MFKMCMSIEFQQMWYFQWFIAVYHHSIKTWFSSKLMADWIHLIVILAPKSLWRQYEWRCCRPGLKLQRLWCQRKHDRMFIAHGRSNSLFCLLGPHQIVGSFGPPQLWLSEMYVSQFLFVTKESTARMEYS